MTNYSFFWRPEYMESFIVLITATLCYVLFHYLEDIIKFDTSTPELQAKAIHKKRLGGFVLLGLIPALVITFCLKGTIDQYGLSFNQSGRSLLFVTGLYILLFPILRKASRKSEQWKLYPQIRRNHWTSQHLKNSRGTWMLYMAGYEFFFRGFLLFALANLYGSWPAIFIMTALYVYVHLPKTIDETIGCIPIGILFGYMALSSGSIIGPFLIHTLIGSTTEYFCIKFNPEMELK